MTRTQIVILLAIFTALAACNRQKTAPSETAVPAQAAPAPSPEPESKVPAIDACSVLTGEEIQAALGELKEGPTPDTGLSQEKLCKYTVMSGSWLQTSLYGSDKWEWQKGITSEMHPKTLSGVGDEAFSVKRGTDSVVYVRKGGGVLEISCSCSLTEAEALAAKGASRI